MERDLMRRLLDAAGYVVTERSEGAVAEVFVFLGAERHRGFGLSLEDAYVHLGETLFPTVAARRAASIWLDVLLGTLGPILVEAPAPPPAPPVAEDMEAIANARPEERDAPAPEEDGADRDERPDVSGSPPPIDRYVVSIEALVGVIDEGAFALLAPELQRIEIAGIAASARALGEVAEAVAGPQHRIETAVGRVTGRCGELAKRYWPGTVRTLQRAATPADVRMPGQATPTTWSEAAASAQRAYDAFMEGTTARGLDACGYADTVDTMAPEPTHEEAERHLVAAEEVIAGIAANVSSLASAMQAPRALPACVTQTACTLRWLRGRVDPIRWGIAMGTLRRVGRLLPDDAATRSSFLTPTPWSQLAGIAGDAGTASVTDTEDAPIPASDASDPDVISWLQDAFDAMNGPDLAALLRPHPFRARIEALASRETFPEVTEPSRFKRRLRDIVRRLQEAPAPHDPIEEPAPAEPDSDVVALPPESVLQRTRGARVLFVSNRSDAEVASKLCETLVLRSITVCDGTKPRQVESACRSVRRGGYDLVLAVTGFLFHAVDASFVAAAGAADIPLVRVDRGRPAACLRALVRDFGGAVAAGAMA